MENKYIYRKKKTAFPVVLAALILSSCGKYKTLNISTADIAERAVTVAETESPVMLDLTQNGNSEMYGVAREDITEGCLYRSSNDDDISVVVVVKAKNEDTLTHIELALRAEANELSRAWRYNEYNSKLSDNRLLKSRGLYTILAVTEKTTEVESVFDEMLSTE